MDEWRVFLSNEELSTEDMQAATKLWKDRFEQDDLKAETKVRVAHLFGQNTRKSKKEARDKVHSAFHAHLKHVYGHQQMGKFFVKYPPAALSSLLEAWQQYMASPEYHRQRARSDRRNESAGVVHQQRQLKHRCHVLRYQRRRAVKWAPLVQNGIWLGPDVQKLVHRLWSGELDAEVDELTKQHGYGKLHATPGYLFAPTLFDYAPVRRSVIF